MSGPVDLQEQPQQVIDPVTEAVQAAASVPTTQPDTSIPPPDPSLEVGKIVLFVDQNESYHGNAANFAAIAQFAKSYGVDTISPKRADGEIKWYGTPEELAKEREAVLAEGVGYMPFTYCYGPRFGDNQVRGECAVLAEIMSVNNHAVCADLESEWNGQFAAASLFDECMRPVPGLLYLTTFGDPRTQNSPIREWAPCVNAWVPQDYSNWLASLDGLDASVGMTIVQPALDLSQEFGNNNVVQIAAQMKARGHKTLWLWDHAFARNNPELLRLVVAAFKG